MYSVVFARSSRKELQRLPQNESHRIIKKIELLASHPRPVDCKKLEGEENLWRIRIGDYRVVYAIDDLKKIIEIFIVRHRKDVYR